MNIVEKKEEKSYKRIKKIKYLFFNFVIDFLLYLIKINNFLRHKKKE